MPGNPQGMKVPKSSRKPKRDDAEQSRAFIEKAREIEADEEKSAADDLMKQLVSQPPEPRKKPAV